MGDKDILRESKMSKETTRRNRMTRQKSCNTCSHRVKEYGKDGLPQYFCEVKNRLRVRPFGSPCEHYDTILKPKRKIVK